MRTARVPVPGSHRVRQSSPEGALDTTVPPPPPPPPPSPATVRRPRPRRGPAPPRAAAVPQRCLVHRDWFDAAAAWELAPVATAHRGPSAGAPRRPSSARGPGPPPPAPAHQVRHAFAPPPERAPAHNVQNAPPSAPSAPVRPDPLGRPALPPSIGRGSMPGRWPVHRPVGSNSRPVPHAPAAPPPGVAEAGRRRMLPLGSVVPPVGRQVGRRPDRGLRPGGRVAPAHPLARSQQAARLRPPPAPQESPAPPFAGHAAGAAPAREAPLRGRAGVGARRESKGP